MSAKKNFKTLAEIRPDLVSQWDVAANGDLTPETVAGKSSRKVGWVCENYPDHRWEASIRSRTVSNSGCPYCTGRKVKAGFNDLESKQPEIAAEWDHEKNGDLKPSDVTAMSGKRVWWRCPECGHSWRAVIAARVTGSGCMKCTAKERGRKLMRPEKGESFADVCPDLVDEWSDDNELRPDEVKPYSAVQVKWVCKECGRQWETTVSSRARGTGCPLCAAMNRRKKKDN